MAAKKLKELTKSMDGKPPVLSVLDEQKILVKLPAAKINKELRPFWNGPLFGTTEVLTTKTGPVGNINGPSGASFDAEVKRVKKLLDWKEVKKELILAKQMDFNIRLSGLGKTKEGDAKNANQMLGVVNMATLFKKMGLLFARCNATVASFNTTLDALESVYSKINGNHFHSSDRQRKREYINRYTKFATDLRQHFSVAGAFFTSTIDDMIVKLSNDMAASGNAAIAGLNAAHATKIKQINKKHLKEMSDMQDAHKLEMETVIAKYEAVILDLKDALDRSQKLNKKYELSLTRAIGMLDKYDSGLAAKESQNAEELSDETQQLDQDILKDELKHAKNGVVVDTKTKLGIGLGALAVVGLGTALAVASKGSDKPKKAD